MKDIILKTLKKNKKGEISLEELYSIFSSIERKKIRDIVSKLVKKNKLIKKKEKFFLPEKLGFFKVLVVKDCNGFIIAEKLKDSTKVLILKKFSKGALCGDIAFALKTIYKNTGEKHLEEAKIEKIIEETKDVFTGIVIKKQGKFYLKPDSFSKSLFKIKKSDEKGLSVYDKVIVKIFKRSIKYQEIICTVLKNCKTSLKASNCADAIALSLGASFSFEDSVIEEAKKLKEKITKKDFEKREDLTKEIIFTIDGITAKDLDDAVSIEKFKDHYILGVHIADVSHFVKPFGIIDQEAKKRGTSIYYANKVVPMLPNELSCDLCSLNPNEKKLAFSVLLKLDFNGKVLDYKLKKTIISSKIKGVYEEINDILEKKENSFYFEKYKLVLEKIEIMHELYLILKNNKIKRNAVEIITKESIIKLDENEKTISVEEKKSGVAEEIIEEFMILANTAVATFAIEKKLPFIYRVHESPKSEKIFALKELLKKLQIPYKELNPPIKPYVLSNILKKYRNTNLFSILNINILRSMEKAEYKETPIGHFGLALKKYTHFTSPIRRYPDLLIHRVLSEYIKNSDLDSLNLKYKKYVKKAAKSSSKAEKKAISIERSCLDCFKAEFLEDKVGEKFKGEISSIIDRGIFVLLENTVEGFISLRELGSEFTFSDNLKFVSKDKKKSFEIGQKVEVIVKNVNISLGKIDFSFA